MRLESVEEEESGVDGMMALGRARAEVLVRRQMREVGRRCIFLVVDSVI